MSKIWGKFISYSLLPCPGLLCSQLAHWLRDFTINTAKDQGFFLARNVMILHYKTFAQIQMKFQYELAESIAFEIKQIRKQADVDSVTIHFFVKSCHIKGYIENASKRKRFELNSPTEGRHSVADRFVLSSCFRYQSVFRTEQNEPYTLRLLTFGEHKRKLRLAGNLTRTFFSKIQIRSKVSRKSCITYFVISYYKLQFFKSCFSV